ncbi:MAG: methyltransferase domain-containing protein [Methylobacterium frigidaeris]
MDAVEAAAAPLVEAFLTRLDREFRQFGAAGGMPPRLRDAVRATPRHRFVHRFRDGRAGPLLDFDADPLGLLPLVYRGEPLTHVDAAGAALPSTNSQAAYVLWLVALLDVRDGSRVLEIGSGSGWLLAVMAALAGAGGHATGIEILPDLAAQSRADLAAAIGDRAAVIAGDATRDPIPGGPFDRVMITAATWDPPARLFDLVAEGGFLLVPLRLPGDEGCEVTLLRRSGAGFAAQASFPGFFVPLVGAGQAAGVRRLSLSDLGFLGTTGPDPSWSAPFRLGGDGRRPGPASWPFRHYLALTEPGYAVFAAGEGDDRAATPFGIVDEASSSLALCRDGRLFAYGTLDAARRLAAAYRRWCDLGMPGPGSWSLEVCRAEAAPAAGPDLVVEQRGGSALIRRLPEQAGAWRALLPDA